MSELSDAELRALQAVDSLGERAWAPMLAELIAIPSITGTAAESEAQRWVAGHLERIGLEVDLWSCDLTALRQHEEFPGTEAPRDEAWGLVGVTPGATEPPRLVLQGHVDVVPTGDLGQWVNGDPFTPHLRDGVMFGRGACDMKAGVVANLVAVEALRQAEVTLPGPVAVHSVVSEEDGGLGAFATLQRGHTGRTCVITEPTDGTVITANAGALTFTLTVTGLATHGSTRYEGVSAFDVFLPVYQALQDLERDRNTDVPETMSEYPIAFPLMVGRLDAGDWSSSVPDRLVAEGRYGVRLDEPVAVARAAFEKRVSEACAADPWLRDHPVHVAWSGGQFASGHFAGPDSFVAGVRHAYADATGRSRPRERGAPYGSDLRLYNAGGIPSVHLGPGEVRYAHSPLEQVRLAEIGDAARTLVLLALRS